jgi:hypothetical protein
VNPEQTRVDCSVGPLALGQAKSFTLTYYSPTSGTSIDLAWDAVFDSGTPPGGSNGDNGSSNIALEAIKLDEVKSAVPASSTDMITVFTGNFAVPSSTDQFATSVSVPPVAFNTTASVLESSVIYTADPTCKAQGNFRNCYQSKVNVNGVAYEYSPGTSNYLTFVLRVDRSNLRGGAKLDSVIIRYTADDESTIESNVNFCDRDASGNPLPDADGTPCIAQASDFTRRNAAQGWFGFQWILISLKNGRISVY